MNMLAMLLALAPIATGPGTPFYAGMPPERFRTLASVKLIVTTAESLPSFCRTDLPPGLELKGCHYRDLLGRPVVVVSDPCPRGDFEESARILCHELAHVAGWPANHPE